MLGALPAHAVILRGRVTTQLGAPLPGSRVQLIRLNGGPHNVADTIAGPDGEYEIRTDLAGRFLLLTSPSITTTHFAPQIGNAFYAGRTDLLTKNIALNDSAITPQQTSASTLSEMPLEELSEQPTQVIADQLLTQATVIRELRATLSTNIVQFGQLGTPATLFSRGAPVDKTVVDGISAELLGGRFNLATLTPTGLAAIASTPAVELAPAANPLYAVDADAGVLALHTPVASTLHPVLVYSGDGGTLSTLRNEATGSVVYRRADALVSASRLNTDNDLPARRLHLITSAANLGYNVSAGTSLRLTLRDDVDAAPLPSPFALYDVVPATKLAAQNLYGGFTFDTRTARNWHNLLRYGMVRARSQAYDFGTPASGAPVAIIGANGYSASGVASFLPIPSREDLVTNRDESTYQTDYPVRPWLSALFLARYADERGADLTPAQFIRLERTHFSFAGELQGEVKHRFFYQASGFLDHASRLGFSGSPRLGLEYVPVREGSRKFRGTSLHLNGATGDREPSTLETELLAHSAYARSRTFDAGLDQSIIAGKLTLHATYFHNQFSHQTETLNPAPLTLSNALAYRTQGFESELRYQPRARLLFDGGYSYLASLVEHSAASASFNSSFVNIPIGGSTALVGARLFYRPPSTGFVAAQFTEKVFTASLKASFASRSDGSTGLVLNPTLLLPNRNLSPGYASVDASFTYNVTHAITLFTQMTNLLDQRHIAPIGFLSTPFVVRTGLRIRLGHE